MNTIPRKKAAAPSRPEPKVLIHQIEGKAWTFYFGVNEICEIETALGKGVGALLRDMQGDLSISTLVAILTAGLRDDDGNPADAATVRAFLSGAGVKAVATSTAEQVAQVLGG